MSAITITCHMCSKQYVVDVILDDMFRYQRGAASVQECFPYLSPAERELFISQTCDDCWHKLFPKEEDNAGESTE